MIHKIGDEVFYMRDNKIVQENIAAVIQIEQMLQPNGSTFKSNPHTRQYSGIKIEITGVNAEGMTVEQESKVIYLNVEGRIITNAFTYKQELLDSL